jgi:hypothetical protein
MRTRMRPGVNRVHKWHYNIRVTGWPLSRKMGKMHKRTSRVAVREPFCPLGCKTTSGAIYRIGLGSCTGCVSFNSQSVLLQGITITRLVAEEDALNSKSSTKEIPGPPPSPDGKKTKEAETIAAAQKFFADCAHQVKSGFGADDSLSEKEQQANKAAVLKQKQKGQAAQKKAIEKTALNDRLTEVQFDIEDTVPLTVVSIVGTEVEIRDSPGAGRGVFTKGIVKKGKYVARYDGDRVDPVTGDRRMFCSRVKRLMSTVSAVKKQQIQQLRYSKVWALINRKGGARICIDGTLSASVILDDVPNRGGLGIAALLNSSHKSGKAPNCIFSTLNSKPKPLTPFLFFTQVRLQIVFYSAYLVLQRV